MDYALTALIWPLVFLLLALLVLRQVGGLLAPVAAEVVRGLSAHAQRYAFAYAMAMVYASAASLQALADEATRLGWLYVAAAAKVIQPGAVALIAYVSKSPTTAAAKEPAP